MLALALKTCVSLGALALFAWLIDLEKIEPLLAATEWNDLLLAIALFIPGIFLQGYRLSRLSALKQPLSFLAALEICWIGLFFSQVLPSSVGGDPIRVWRIHRHGYSISDAIVVAVVDRVIGLLGLCIIIFTGVFWMLAQGADASLLFSATAIVSAGLAGWIALSWFDRLAPKRLQTRLPRRLTTMLTTLGSFLRAATYNLRQAIPLFGLAVTSHLFQALMVWQIARAMNVGGYLLPILFILPLSNIAAMLPVSLAGWGIREAVLIVALGSLGLEQEKVFALSILTGLCTMAATLPGFAIWYATKR